MPVSSNFGGTQIRASQDTGLHTGFVKRAHVEVVPHITDRLISAIHNDVFRRDPLNDPRRRDPNTTGAPVVMDPGHYQVGPRSHMDRKLHPRKVGTTAGIETVTTPIGPVAFSRPPKPAKPTSTPSTSDLDFLSVVYQGPKTPLPRSRFYE